MLQVVSVLYVFYLRTTMESIAVNETHDGSTGAPAPNSDGTVVEVVAPLPSVDGGVTSSTDPVASPSKDCEHVKEGESSRLDCGSGC